MASLPTLLLYRSPIHLQIDNGGEFNGIALDGKARKEQLSDEVRTHA